MFDFFAQVLGYIHLFATYFTNFLTALGVFINTVGDAIGTPIFVAGFMPSIIGSSMLVVISLGVVKFLIGR